MRAFGDREDALFSGNECDSTGTAVKQRSLLQRLAALDDLIFTVRAEML